MTFLTGIDGGALKPRPFQVLGRSRQHDQDGFPAQQHDRGEFPEQQHGRDVFHEERHDQGVFSQQHDGHVRFAEQHGHFAEQHGHHVAEQHGHGQLAAMRGHVRFAEDTEQQTVERGQVFPQHVVDRVSIIGAFTFSFDEQCAWLIDSGASCHLVGEGMLAGGHVEVFEERPVSIECSLG